jgi:hypothetical protein
MAQSTEEITVQSAPARVVKTTRVVNPSVKTEPPQERYVKKKAIFRFYQIVWYLLGVIEAFLIFRIILKALGANPASGFTDFIYTVSYPFALPFLGMFRTVTEGDSIFELSTFIGCIIYFLVALGLVEIMQIIKPTTPEEVEENV